MDSTGAGAARPATASPADVLAALRDDLAASASAEEALAAAFARLEAFYAGAPPSSEPHGSPPPLDDADATPSCRDGGSGRAGTPPDELSHGLLFESTVHGVVYQDAGGSIVAANPSAERILGISLDELRGRTSADPRWRAVREDGSDFPGDEHPASVALRTGRAVHDVVFGVHNPAAGSVRWITVSATPEFRPGEDEPYRVFTTFADVTELKRAEQDLRESEERMRIAQEATGLGVFDWDIAAGTLEWDERTRALFGVGVDEPVTFATFMAGVHPDDRVRVEAEIRHALETSGSRSVELLCRVAGRPGGGERHLRSTGHLTFAGGTPVRLVGTVEDVTERELAEEALRREAARLQAVVDAIPIGITFLDETGRLAGHNDEAARMWHGIAPVGSLGDLAEYEGSWPGAGRPLGTDEWPGARALLEREDAKDVVVDIERFDGSRGTIVLSAAPVTLEGRTAGAVVGMQDITELRRAEQVLRLLTDEVRILHEASVLDTSISLAELTRTVAVQARSLLESDGCSVYRVDDRGVLRRQLLVGSPSAKSRPGVRRLVEDAVERAARRGPGRSEPAHDGAARPGGEALEGTCLAVPLALRDGVFGAIALHFRQPRRFDEHYERVARAFADQAALAIESARLRARVAESAAEGERSRLARDLHDSVTQSLFAASLKAEALSRVDDVSPRTRDTIEQVRRLTRGALAQMRTMLLEMRGEPLSDVPLPELLRHLAEAAASSSHVDVSLTVRGAAGLPADLHETLYRIAQEALNNVVRHARAARAWVMLEVAAGSVRLVVGDDGLGFDPAVPRASHLGLRTMQERAHSAGADFRLSTRVGSGTVIGVEWPGGEHGG